MPHPSRRRSGGSPAQGPGHQGRWIHGGRSQSQRDRALAAFTDQTVLALVATDVAACGIHVDGVAGVIHFDPPEDGKTYTHRSGRTARAGAAGVVVSLVKDDDRKLVRSNQRELGLSVPVETLEEFRRHTPERDPKLWPVPTRVLPNAPGSGKAKNKGKGKNSQSGSSKQRNAGAGEPSEGKAKARTDNVDGASWETTTLSRPGAKRRTSGAKRGSGAKSSARSGRSRPKNKAKRSDS
ncbi:MAG: helicase C-terminal domain-containing protein [Acidimicrobiales bacterium]